MKREKLVILQFQKLWMAFETANRAGVSSRAAGVAADEERYFLEQVAAIKQKLAEWPEREEK